MYKLSAFIKFALFLSVFVIVPNSFGQVNEPIDLTSGINILGAFNRPHTNFSKRVPSADPNLALENGGPLSPGFYQAGSTSNFAFQGPLITPASSLTIDNTSSPSTTTPSKSSQLPGSW